MGFDNIDKQFAPKPSTTIKLECSQCGGTEGVTMMHPCWYNEHKLIALCINHVHATAPIVPTDHPNKALRDESLRDYNAYYEQD